MRGNPMPADPTLPLTGRAPEEVIFRRGTDPVTVARFLAEVAAFATRLPDEGPVLNFCADRYMALLGFAAALSRGQVTLLSADRSAPRLADIARLHGARYALSDTDAVLPLPVLRPSAEPAGPGANPAIPANAIAAIASNTIFTNVALTDDGDVWWEGLTDTPPAHLVDWQGHDWSPGCGRLAAHANSRFTAPAQQCPSIDPDWQNPAGVPISAIIFGGRRPGTMPLVYQSFNWAHGVYIGATMGSETTAAAAGAIGQVRRDPMAMLPFCGYDMGEYFAHWLEMRRHIRRLPRIFHVNWFRKGPDGRFLWPGFSENMRVLEWIIRRCRGTVAGHETMIGWTPQWEDFNSDGLHGFARADFDRVMAVNPAEWRTEVLSQGELFLRIYDSLPKELIYQRELLSARLSLD